MQVIEDFLAAEVDATLSEINSGLDSTTFIGSSLDSLTLIVGLENVNPFAERCIQPFSFVNEVVATCCVPSVVVTDIVAFAADPEKP